MCFTRLPNDYLVPSDGMWKSPEEGVHFTEDHAFKTECPARSHSEMEQIIDPRDTVKVYVETTMGTRRKDLKAMSRGQDQCVAPPGGEDVHPHPRGLLQLRARRRPRVRDVFHFAEDQPVFR